MGDYLLGINEEIRQVSSSEHIVSGTLGLSQINVENVDTLFVNRYLVHNDVGQEGGGGSGAGGGADCPPPPIHIIKFPRLLLI